MTEGETGRRQSDRDTTSPAVRGAAHPRRTLLLVAAALAVLAFLILAVAVVTHAGGGLDGRILGLVCENRVRPASWFLTRYTRFGSWYILAPLAVLVVAVLVSRGMRRQAEIVALSLTSAVLLNLVLKAFIQRQPPGDIVALSEASRYSFPSGHTMSTTAFALSLVVIAWPTRWRWPVVVCAVAGALAMGFSRVYIGVHWPSDVVAGWLMAGVVVAVITTALHPWHATAKHDEAPIRVVLFDWGNTLMVDDGQSGPMAEWPRVAAVPGAPEALAALHGRYRLCVATNADDSGADAVMAALGRVGLARFIDRVFSSRDIGARKPDPAFYAAVLEALRADEDAVAPSGTTATAPSGTTAAPAEGNAVASGGTTASAPDRTTGSAPPAPPLRADQVVMVGDNHENDVAGAIGAGLRAVWLNPGPSPAPGTPATRADEIRSLADLPDVLTPND